MCEKLLSRTELQTMIYKTQDNLIQKVERRMQTKGEIKHTKKLKGIVNIIKSISI